MVSGVDNMNLNFEPIFNTFVLFKLHIDYICFEIHTRFISDNFEMDGDLNARNSMQEALAQVG